MQRRRIAHRRVQHEHVPIGPDTPPGGFNVPAIPTSEIAATLALNGDAGRIAGVLRVAGRNLGAAAFAVRDCVVRRASFRFEGFRFPGGRKGLFPGESRKRGGIGRRLLNFGRFDLIETFGWINSVTLGGQVGSRHGDARATDERHVDPTELAAHAGPFIPAQLKIRCECSNKRDTSVKGHGIPQEPLETGIVRIGDGCGHAKGSGDLSEAQ